MKPTDRSAIQPSQIAGREVDSTRSPVITFFGNFGTQNLGNECTLRAIIQNTRTHLPSSTVRCICPRPGETSADQGVPAFPITYRFGRSVTPASARGRDNAAKRLIRRLAIRVPRELIEWARAIRILKGTDMLVMTGTGMLGDFGIGPLDLHYEILKWSVVARLCGCKLLFVSVGAGPIRHPLSRWIVKAALSLAHYRSYRDQFSYDYLEGIGFDASKDHVYPDLAFSLLGSEASVPRRARDAKRRLIGLGLMEYYGQHRSPWEGELIYQRYIERVASFAAWLLEQGHSVRLLVGDLAYDKRVKVDLLRLLKESGARFDAGQIIDEPLESPENLIEQLAQTDIVVATRFHNVLLALMLSKPVIALAYHQKLRSLMAGVGAAEYSVDAEELDVTALIERFRRLSENAEAFTASIKQRTDEYRRSLDEQYAHMFGDLLGSRSSAAVDDRYAARVA